MFCYQRQFGAFYLKINHGMNCKSLKINMLVKSRQLFLQTPHSVLERQITGETKKPDGGTMLSYI